MKKLPTNRYERGRRLILCRKTRMILTVLLLLQDCFKDLEMINPSLNLHTKWDQNCTLFSFKMAPKTALKNIPQKYAKNAPQGDQNLSLFVQNDTQN